MNSDIKELASDIANKRRIFEQTQDRLTEVKREKVAKSQDVNAEMIRLKLEFEAQMQALREKTEESRAEELRLERELDAIKNDLDAQNAAYAKLLQAQNETMYYEELSKELEIICQGFEAYFQAHVYQHDDILFIVGAYDKGLNGVLNSNDLGLGKTFESIVSIYILAKKFEADEGRKPRILWLTKKSLVRSTPKELKQWWPKVTCFSTDGCNTPKDKERLLELYLVAGDIYLTNYETIRTSKQIAAIDWDLIVIDEVHKLKGGANPNGATAIWEAARDVCRKARFILMLSGTPMVNRPQEMWSYLHIFSPEKFPSIKQFESHYMEMKSFAGEYQLMINPNKLLTGALKGQMIRRTRQEVGLQLPEFNRIVKYLEMNPQQKDLYKMMRERFFIWLDEQQTKPLTATVIIAQLTRLRQINVWPAGIKVVDPLTKAESVLDVQDSSKIDEAMEIIQDAQDQVVIFSTFNEPLQEIKRRCAVEKISCKVINGESVDKMGEYENEFQQGELTVLCINSAMGEGLNLQKNPNRWPGGANIGIHLDLWWSPARNDSPNAPANLSEGQTEGRIYRQGANQPITWYTLLNESSVDGFVIGKLDAKAEQFQSVLAGDEIRPASDWRDYLEGVI